MATGKIKWFNYQKGFGFITPDNGNRDIFVHISAVEKSGIQNMAEGMAISYDTATEKGKESAQNLKAI
jgi:CspA family cold shock protein